MALSPLLSELIEALRTLPGVGPKSAQRMAFQLLKDQRERGKYLANALLKAMDNIKHCQRCRTFSETPLCKLCESDRRNRHQLCVVENPSDIIAIEQTGSYQGYYFVLMGHLSPLDGVGPQEIGLPVLEQQFSQHTLTEIILATNPTVEGQATAYYIAEIAKKYPAIKVTRIAHGVPLGGELEYIDIGTLAHALEGRGALA